MGHIKDDELTGGIRLSTRINSNDSRVHLFFTGDITSGFIHHITDAMDTYPPTTEFVVVINSDGGDVSYINYFTYFASKMNIKEVHGIGQSSSAALAILMACKQVGIPVFIDKLCHIVLHRVMTNWFGEDRSERISVFNKDWVVKYEKEFDKINETLLNAIPKEKLADYKDGKDVYLLGVDLIKMGIFKELKAKKFKGKKNGKEKK